MNSKIEEILGTTKGAEESWTDVFNRLNSTGAVDFKVLSRIVSCLLDNLDKK